MKTFKLVIEYDGSDYHGWQRQDGDATIQEELEKALEIMTRQKIAIAGSGRTDAGVHALGQTASFRCDTRLSAEVFLRGLNSLLPEDIVIRECMPASDDFHARFSVKQKTYQYRILNRPIASALLRRYVWHVKKKLDISAMQQAGEFLLGSHDFKSFQGQGSDVKDTIRRILFLEISRESDRIYLDITGNGFLRFMVRNIVGTLVEVGMGKITPAVFNEILLSKDRNRAGMTAPAQGLFLMKVDYADESDVPKK